MLGCLEDILSRLLEELLLKTRVRSFKINMKGV